MNEGSTTDNLTGRSIYILFVAILILLSCISCDQKVTVPPPGQDTTAPTITLTVSRAANEYETVHNFDPSREFYVNLQSTFTIALAGEDSGGVAELKLYQDNVEVHSRAGNRANAVDTLRIQRNVTFTKPKSDVYSLHATVSDFAGNTSSTPELIVRPAPWPLHMEINSLAVRIVTSSDYGAGTNNDVYFEIGPVAWELDKPNYDDFESGDDDTYQLPLPPNITLSTDDIVWLRLQKKGIGGFTGSPDSLLFDGEWHPERIHLIINGVDRFEHHVGTRLHQDSPIWTLYVKPFAPDTVEERFARSLRLEPNRPLSPGDESIAWLTTPFKIAGISGWLGTALNITCATGTVYRQPAMSTDGLATIDLELESVKVGNYPHSPEFSLDGQVHTRFLRGGGENDISHTRYLRVEYAHGGNPVPANGNHVRICGRVKWDTDAEGWYEIHPRGPSDVTVLP